MMAKKNSEKQELTDEELVARVQEKDKETGRDRLAEQAPKIPQEDYDRAMKIIADITERYSNIQLTEGDEAFNMWRKCNAEAKTRLGDIGLKAHAEVVTFGRNLHTGKSEQCDNMWDETKELMVPEMYGDPIMIQFRIHVDDWESKGKKLEKAEQSIVEAERRRSMGEQYQIKS